MTSILALITAAAIVLFAASDILAAHQALTFGPGQNDNSQGNDNNQGHASMGSEVALFVQSSPVKGLTQCHMCTK